MAIDFGWHSPLVDLFAQGQMPLDMRLLAAANQVAVDPIEQIVLLALLTHDGDARVVARAWESYRALPPEIVAGVLGQADLPERLRAWVQAHDPADSPVGAAPAEAGTVVDAAAPETAAAASAGERATAEEPADEEVRTLASLSVPERIKMAMLGTREQRAVLVRDPNRVVSTAVLSSPKLSDSEVENFARMTNVAADVLRIVGTNRSWLRNYAVVAALVRNPRTPPAISLGLVSRLQERELKGLTVDRNVPEALRLTARKALAAKESRRG